MRRALKISGSNVVSVEAGPVINRKPITTITIIFPVVYLFHPYVKQEVFMLILGVAMLLTAFFYVFDIKIKKPGNGGIAIMMVFVTLVMLKVLNIIR